MTIRGAVRRAAVWAYRVLAAGCPADTTDHPEEMVRDFRLALEAEYETRGAFGAAAFWTGSMVDTVTIAMRAWGKILTETVAGVVKGPSSFRHSLRSLRSTWLISTVAVVTIALGVALTTTTFSVVYGVLLRPLPFPDPDRLVALDLIDLDGGASTPQFEALDLRDFRLRQTAFESLDGYMRRRVSFTDTDGFAQSLRAGFVTASMLDGLGVVAHLGRTFLPGEDFTKDIQHVVLGYDVWRTRYGASENVIGTTVRVDGRNLTVIGVMPAGFAFPVSEELWMPMDFDLPTVDRGSGRSFAVLGRLKRGVSIEAATEDARTVAAQISAENPDIFPRLGAMVYPLAERHLPGGIAPMLGVMLAAVFCVLFIACINVANLLLSRSLARARELSIRRALGASRGKIAGQMFWEAGVLSVAGSGLGLGLSALGMKLVARSVPHLSLPYWVDIALAGPALGFNAGLILLVALTAGALPAVRAVRGDFMAGLRDGSRGSTGRRWGRTGGKLVVAQIAGSCALLIGSGLLIKSLVVLRTMDMGYDAERVMMTDIRLPNAESLEPDARADTFSDILERAAHLPGVRRASLVRSPPGTGPTFSWDVEVQGEEYSANVYAAADGVPIAHGYFDVMGVQLLEGRDFSPEESRFGTEPVLIVNETFARRHLGSDPIGRHIRIDGGNASDPWFRVIGVVRDTYIGSRSGGIGLDPAPRNQLYISWGVAPYAGGTLVVGTERSAEQIVPDVRALLREVVPTMPMHNTTTLTRAIEGSTWVFGLLGSVFAVFGGLALVMSAVGLYGMISFSVNQRRSEMSVRMALGATGQHVVRLVLGEAGRRLLWGTGLGLVLGALLAQGIETALFGVERTDLSVYSVILTVVIATGLLSAVLPALRAAREDPMRSLRQ